MGSSHILTTSSVRTLTELSDIFIKRRWLRMLWGLPFRKEVGRWLGHSRSSSVAGSSLSRAAGWVPLDCPPPLLRIPVGLLLRGQSYMYEHEIRYHGCIDNDMDDMI